MSRTEPDASNPLGPPPASGPPRPWRRRWRLKTLGLYPPYLGAGVKVRYMAPDLACFDIEMKLRFWNSNPFGSHFGGSLYSMCDPFFVLILFEHLGADHVVWDKSARIRFWRPGRSSVFARFHLPEDEIDRLRSACADQPKVEPTYTARVVDGEGKIVAEVVKELHLRRKDSERGVAPRASSAESG